MRELYRARVRQQDCGALEGTCCEQPVDELKIDKDLDPGGASLKAKTVAAGVFVGDGSKLTGIKHVAGECKTKGEVVKGIKPDGSLICIKAMDPSNLPPAAIDEVSNSLLYNQFIDVEVGSKVAIKDHDPVGVAAVIDFPDIGVAQSLKVHVDVSNSDLKTVTLRLFDPANASYLLYDKGSKGTTLKAVYPSPNKPVSGDLTSWVGKNPKGKWRLQVIDTGFKNSGIDGALNSWKIEIQTLSNKKVRVAGNLIVDGVITTKNANIGGPLTVTGKVTGQFPGGGSAYVSSGEYENYPPGTSLSNREIPCTLCYVDTSSSSFMQSGRHTCDSPTKLAYDGILMAAHHGHSAGNYVCMDAKPEAYDGNGSNHNLALLYNVNFQGHDPSKKYKGGKLINCAICLR